MVVLNLMLLLLYLLFDSSCILTQSLVLNLDSWFVLSSNRFITFLIFHYYILLLYWSFFNLRSSIISCLNSGDIYFYLSISLFISKLFYGEVFGALVILSAILFPMKSPVPSVVFWMTLFEEVSGCIYYLCFWLYFYQYFFPYF